MILPRVNKCICNFGWVDVENEYYVIDLKESTLFLP